MILRSILIDNTYGTNVSRIIFYGKNIIEFEEEILKSNNFYTEVDKKNKEFLQQKIEGLVQETLQVQYLNKLIKQLSEKYYITFQFEKDFFVTWKSQDKRTDFKANFS